MWRFCPLARAVLRFASFFDAGHQIRRMEVDIVIIASDFEVGYLIALSALLGIILIGALLSALHLDRWHPKMISSAIGALLGFALIEAVPLIT